MCVEGEEMLLPHVHANYSTYLHELGPLHVLLLDFTKRLDGQEIIHQLFLALVRGFQELEEAFPIRLVPHHHFDGRRFGTERRGLFLDVLCAAASPHVCPVAAAATTLAGDPRRGDARGQPNQRR